jgi:hypothetical protein
VPLNLTRPAMELDDIKYRKSSGLEPQVLAHVEDQARGDESSSVVAAAAENYRLYKRRWVGLVGLVGSVFYLVLSVC